MALRQQIVQKQTQRLVMTQDLRQSIELLAMSQTDLLDKIQNELIENPLLEETSEIAPNKTQETREIERKQTDMDQKRSAEESDGSSDKEWQNELENQRENGNASNQVNSDSKQQFLENSIQANESLQDHLIAQLHLTNLDERSMGIGIAVISFINDKGFFSATLSDIIETIGENEQDSLMNIIGVVQQLEPIGCATRDIRESLLVQAKLVYPGDEILHQILEFEFESMEKLEYEKIARKLHIEKETVLASLKKIRTLEPYPGMLFAPPRTEYIVADVSVIEYEGDLEVVLNDELLPGLALNSDYATILSTKTGKKEDIEYIESKLASAQWLLNGLKQRKSTLLKTMQSIIKHQKDFFLKGPGALKPLTLKHIALDIEMHESTISRITSNKFVQTKWGVYELKYFFNSSVKTNQGESSHSSTSIQGIIKKIISEENPDDPVSDQAIVEILKDIDIKIARRTVAKYRNKMNILPVDRRRKIKKYNN